MPPSTSFLKINTDAAFTPGRQSLLLDYAYAVSWVKSFLLELAWIPNRIETDEGEALGLLQVLQRATDLHLQNVIFELDAKRVTYVLEYGTIISDSKRLLALNPTYGVGHIKR